MSTLRGSPALARMHAAVKHRIHRLMCVYSCVGVQPMPPPNTTPSIGVSCCTCQRTALASVLNPPIASTPYNKKSPRSSPLHHPLPALANMYQLCPLVPTCLWCSKGAPNITMRLPAVLGILSVGLSAQSAFGKVTTLSRIYLLTNASRTAPVRCI